MVTNQTNLFLIFIVNGIIIGLLFDFFRVLRITFKTSDIITYIEDILFWILTGSIILYSVFTFNNGEIRLFLFLGILLGCICYMLTLSSYIIKTNTTIINFFKKIIAKILHIILFPIKCILKTIKKLFFKPISFLTINIRKNSTNLLKNIYNSIKNTNKTKNNIKKAKI